jgi:hypothetical protein
LDEIIEEIRRLMIRSTKVVNKGKLSRGEPAIVAGQQKKQQQRSRGADGQLQRTVWDPSGFQQQSREAHEQELMIFVAEDYDVGASLQASYAPASQHIKHTFNGRREAQPSRCSNFEIVLSVVKAKEPKSMHVHRL